MNRIYQSLCFASAIAFLALPAKAQLAGTYSVPATFPTLAAAINSLNLGGVTGPVTILIDAGYTETAPAGGYSLTATGSNANPIIFQKNGVGANPLITAYTGGTGTPGSASQDGIWRLIGSDYITINGIDLTDPNAANPATMEFGYGLFKASVTNGCQNNTIQNCVITLNRVNFASGTAPATDGSRGIDVVNATSNAHTTSLSISAALGANSNNRFYSNTIQNCNIGIALIGFADASPYANADQGNDVGGINAGTGNTIINYGGGAAASNPAAGIRTLAQYSLNISYNTINSNTGAGVNHPSTLRGILLGNAANANATVNNNTITIKGGGTTSQLSGIETTAGSSGTTNTVSINNNVITNCSYTTATSGVFYGIYNNGASPFFQTIDNNTLSNNSTAANSGSYYSIYSTGSVVNLNSISGNNINGITFTGSSPSLTFRGIYNTGASSTSTLTVNGNNIQGIVFNNSASATTDLIYNNATALVQNITNNTFTGLSVNTSGSMYLIYCNNTMPANGLRTISGNSIVTSFTKLLSGGTVYGYYSFATSTAASNEINSNNNFSNITLAGSTALNIWQSADGTTSSPYGPGKTVTGNTFTNVVMGTGNYLGLQVGWSNTNSASTISNNVVSAVTCSCNMTGIVFNTGSHNVFGNTVSSFTSAGATSSVSAINFASPGFTTNIYKNKVYNIENNQSGGSVYGIIVASGTLTNVYNNIVGDLRTPASSAANNLVGMNITGGTTNNVYYNTVRLSAVSAGANFGSSALFVNTAAGLNLRNNIFINNSTAAGTGSTVAYRRSSNTLTSYSNTSNNNSFYAGTPGPANLVFTDGTNMHQTMGTYVPFVTPRDANSITENTGFLSLIGNNANFLHVDPTLGSITESAASNIAGFTDDFDGNIRQGNIGYVGQGTAPDVGADEYETILPNCNIVNGASVSPVSTSICAGQYVALNATGFTVGSGIVYQWRISNVPGGPYTNIPGANSVSYVTPTLSIGNYYYVLLTTCTISGQSAVSVNESTVSVNAYPNLSVSPVTSTICSPGGSSVTLTGSGANSYTWSPAAGLDFTTGVSVQALPAVSTVYTVTGTNLAGCASTITVPVYINSTPSLSASVSPTLICPGASASLQAAASTATLYNVSNITYSPIPTPTVGVTILANSGVAVTPLSTGSLDDGGWSDLTIPFNFNFFGTTYTTYAVNTNGFIFLGSGNPNVNGGYANTFPYTGSGRPAIAVNYADLQFSPVTSGTISTFTVGVSPNRMLVVNWTNGNYYLGAGTGQGTITTQAIVYETSNNIEVHTTLATGQKNSVEGIQNAAGTVAYVAPGRNNVSYTVSVPDGYRWSPVTVSYSWTPSSFLTNTNIANPVANSATSTVAYSVNILASNGCTNSASATMSVDLSPTISIAGGTAAVCNGATVNLTASGADTYSWTNGPGTASVSVNPSVTTIYTVVGTSSLFACPGTAMKTITVNPTPVINISGPPSICMGQSVGLVASGATSYSWANNGSTLSIIAQSPTTTTGYSVVGTNTAGCSGTAVKTVTVYALPGLTVSAAPGFTICEGESVSLIASGISADTYSWSNGATTPITNATPSVNTMYTVTIGNNFTGCFNTAVANIHLKVCDVGIEESTGGITGLSIYPNPNSGQFTVELDNGSEKTIEVLDVTGRILLTEATDQVKTDVRINTFANGVYYVRIRSNNVVEVIKLVKQ